MIDINAIGDLRMQTNYLEVLRKSLKSIYFSWVLKDGIKVVPQKKMACANMVYPNNGEKLGGTWGQGV